MKDIATWSRRLFMFAKVHISIAGNLNIKGIFGAILRKMRSHENFTLLYIISNVKTICEDMLTLQLRFTSKCTV